MKTTRTPTRAATRTAAARRCVAPLLALLVPIAAGNTSVPSEAPQIWGAPDVEDDLALFGNVRGGAAGFDWDVSGSFGVHDSELFSYNTGNASLGLDTPTSFDLGTNRQREIDFNADVSYSVTDRVNVAAGIEWRDEQFGAGSGDPASWAVGPFHEQGFFAGAHGFPGYGPLAVGEWSRSNFAAYGGLEVSGDAGGGWTLGGPAA
ncbi:MAG: hypothetical protein J4F37_13870 [Acidobacteria bacterium]|nr:hypothetical protein [Acidobacteriota bacterium]